ncbi:MAG TPA: urea ABC transporter permease subunit UrtC [Phototrophicaceae bacterium]|nr:urea ABC transporter permease subunit UrtC [Phototrophicaceae bacterium]
MTAHRLTQGSRWIGFIVVAVVLIVVLPDVLSDFQTQLLGRFFTYALVALGLDLIWGYTGMLSLGQGLFFGLGAYCFGMYLNLEAVGTKLPDFMGLYGVKQLPFFWEPFYSPVFAILMAMLIPALLATILGFMLFRSRIQGVYFSIITQALTSIMALLLVGQQKLINGTNGITQMTTIFGAPLSDHQTIVNLYIATVVVLGGLYVGCRFLVNSRFGRLLIAVRDDENRVRFMGYNTVVIKTAVFALSAAIAGLGGVLFVPQIGIISPNQLSIAASIEMVVWVAVGGRGTLIGAIIGAILVNLGKSTISTLNADIWQLIMGVLFIGVVLLFPKGIIGSLGDGWNRIKPLWDKSYVPQPKTETQVEAEAS